MGSWPDTNVQRRICHGVSQFVSASLSEDAFWIVPLCSLVEVSDVLPAFIIRAMRHSCVINERGTLRKTRKERIWEIFVCLSTSCFYRQLSNCLVNGTNFPTVHHSVVTVLQICNRVKVRRVTRLVFDSGRRWVRFQDATTALTATTRHPTTRFDASREADSRWTSQEILSLPWNLKMFISVFTKSPTLIFMLSQLTPVCFSLSTFIVYAFRIALVRATWSSNPVFLDFLWS